MTKRAGAAINRQLAKRFGGMSHALQLLFKKRFNCEELLLVERIQAKDADGSSYKDLFYKTFPVGN